MECILRNKSSGSGEFSLRYVAQRFCKANCFEDIEKGFPDSFLIITFEPFRFLLQQRPHLLIIHLKVPNLLLPSAVAAAVEGSNGGGGRKAAFHFVCDSTVEGQAQCRLPFTCGLNHFKSGSLTSPRKRVDL